MKKSIVSLLSAALIALSVPALAFAATPSPDTVSASTTGANVTVSVSGKKTDADAWIKVASTDKKASNAPADAEVVASFEVTQQNTQAPYTFSYTLGAAYANADVTVYIQHDDNATEVVEKTADANGTITFEQSKLSIHTIVAKKAAAGATTTQKDSGATSPQTGLHTNAAVAVTGAASVAAAGAAVVLRKKVTE